MVSSAIVIRDKIEVGLTVLVSHITRFNYTTPEPVADRLKEIQLEAGERGEEVAYLDLNDRFKELLREAEADGKVIPLLIRRYWLGEPDA